MTMMARVQSPKTLLPVSQINSLVTKTVGYFLDDEQDSFLTSAYCDKDEIQYVYYRSVQRGLSELEKVYCENCGEPLFINEKRGNAMSSSISPELVGMIWIQNETQVLNLVLIESFLEGVKDDLLSHILAHDFSGSIEAVELHLLSSNSRDQIKLAIKNLKFSTKFLERVLPIKFRKRKKVRLKVDDLSSSPLRLSNLSESRLKELKKFLEPPEEHTSALTTKFLSKGSKRSQRSLTTSPNTQSWAEKEWRGWTHQAERLLRRNQKKSGTRKQKSM